ncbi:hypothetical protein [Enterobacter asburiae]|nr:hypothetical protein [Salmonella enterica]EJG8857859.1 hypothetical protein [Salmonella enterica]
MSKIEKETKNSVLMKTLKVASMPIIGTFKLFSFPLILPYQFGKKILDTVINAHGRSDQETNSFDVWYNIKDMNEDKLAFNIRRTALLALICMLAFFIGALLTYLCFRNKVQPMFISSSVVFTMISFAQYFHFAVFCHCFKTRSFDNKLNTFKSLESILPNPFYENVQVKKNGKAIPAEFFPKGKSILKK